MNKNRDLGRQTILLAIGWLAALPALSVNHVALAAEKKPKVLIIGIDGCRPDALAKAKTPALDELTAAGVLLKAENLPDRRTGGETTSHPMWFSILTGVWPDKHGIRRGWYKKERHNKRYPHFFARLKSKDANLVTASVSSWRGIRRHMVSAADINEYVEGDEPTERRAIEVAADPKTDVLFVHFGDPDLAGHKHGFSPIVRAYIAAIEATDPRVGRLVQAVRHRQTYKDENWLILVTTDHGGKGTTHTSRGEVPEIRNVFVIASGLSVQKDSAPGIVHTVDVAATALAHMGVKLNPAWRLDGKPVGLKEDG